MAEHVDSGDQHVDPEDFIRFSLNRRSALKAAAGFTAAGLGAISLGACSGGGSGGQYTGKGNNSSNGDGNKNESGKVPRVSSRAGSVSPTPRHETLLLDQSKFTVFNSFNPFIPNGEQYNGGLGQVCREYLWYFNMATGKTIPWLATKWKYTEDFKKFTIHLNPKAHWNDGEPFTSKDVTFTINLLRKHKSLLGRGPVTEEVETITAPDPHTVVITLKKSDPRYHYQWICGIVSSVIIVPEHIWGDENPT